MDEGLPPRIPFLPDLVVHHEDGVLVTGMDGEILWLDDDMHPLTEVKCPHPMRLRQVSIADGQLYATWLDRELLLACMGNIVPLPRLNFPNVTQWTMAHGGGAAAPEQNKKTKPSKFGNPKDAQ